MSAPLHILHMDLDAFFVACERLQDPSLNGKPVMIGGRSGRGVVSSCSYEARAFGVHSAMPGFKAAKLCPQGIFLPGNMALYSEKSRQVKAFVEARVPVCEFASIDEFYCDLSGMERFFGALKFARELRQAITRETGLTVSMGLAENKLLAKMATNDAKPNGELYIAPGTAKAYLAPKPVGSIPGVGKKSVELLQKLGIQTIADVQALEASYLEERFGKHGRSLWKKANGLSDSPVEPVHERKSIGTERTFRTDVTDPDYLRRVLVGETEHVAFRLRQKGFLAGCVTAKVRYSNFETVTHQARIPFTNQDAHFLQEVHRLFGKVYSAGRPVRLLGVRLSELVTGGHQTDLFRDTEEDLSLLDAMDKMKSKYGPLALRRAAGTQVKRAALPMSE